MRTFPVLLLTAISAGLMALPPAVRAGEPAEIHRWIQQLGSSRYTEREEASQALEAIGPAAREALRQAVQGPDAEVRRRAAAVLRRLESRQEASEMLASPPLRLVYEETPLADALADFAHKTGVKLDLPEEVLKRSPRTITLRTGATSFWEAFDQFCAGGGLHLVPATPPAHSGQVTANYHSVMIVRGNPRITPTDILQPDTPEKPASLTVAEGKPSSVPTCYTGAVRVQALPATPSGDAEVTLNLQVSLEPRLKWQKLLSVRIDQAIDDQDQVRAPRLLILEGKVQGGGATTFINGVPVYPEETAPEGETQPVAVRLPAGEKAAKRFREVRGSLAALVQSAPQALVTVDNVSQALGRTVTGPGSSSVKVLALEHDEGGLLKVRFQVEAPARTLTDGPAAFGNALVFINGRRVGFSEEPLSAQNFALLDSKGHAFRVVQAENTGRRAGGARELELTYDPGEGPGEPAQFIYTGRRSAIVTIPFTLKDVPLP